MTTTSSDLFRTTRCIDQIDHRVRTNPVTGMRMCTRCSLTDDSKVPKSHLKNAKVSVNPSLKRRHTIAERDDFKGCRYCGLIPRTLMSLTIEHLESKHAQGTDAIENLGLSCSACNSMKGAMTEKEFIAWLFERVIPKRIPVEAQIGLHRNEAKRLTMAAAFSELLEYLKDEHILLHSHIHSPGLI